LAWSTTAAQVLNLCLIVPYPQTRECRAAPSEPLDRTFRYRNTPEWPENVALLSDILCGLWTPLGGISVWPNMLNLHKSALRVDRLVLSDLRVTLFLQSKLSHFELSYAEYRNGKQARMYYRSGDGGRCCIRHRQTLRFYSPGVVTFVKEIKSWTPF